MGEFSEKSSRKTTGIHIILVLIQNAKYVKIACDVFRINDFKRFVVFV